MKITATDIQRFSAWLTAEEKTPATIAKYVREARRFSTWLAGRDVLKPLTRSYKAELTEKRAPAGVNGAIAALNCLFHFLNLPECRLKSLKIQRPVFRDEDRELSQAEYRRLLSAAREARNERLLLTMETLCATGIRVSELKFFTAEAVRRGRAWRRRRYFPAICGTCSPGPTTTWRRTLSVWRWSMLLQGHREGRQAVRRYRGVLRCRRRGCGPVRLFRQCGVDRKGAAVTEATGATAR